MDPAQGIEFPLEQPLVTHVELYQSAEMGSAVDIQLLALDAETAFLGVAGMTLHADAGLLVGECQHEIQGGSRRDAAAFGRGYQRTMQADVDDMRIPALIGGLQVGIGIELYAGELSFVFHLGNS